MKNESPLIRLPVCEFPSLHVTNSLIAYQQKGVGVDMTLKSILGVFRLLMLYSRTFEQREKFATLVDSIIECRMLCNFGRPILTSYQWLQKYNEPLTEHSAEWIYLCLSYFFRIFEQFSGDLSFLQKVVFHSWSRKQLSFCYRFFKSISLSCSLIAELYHRQTLKSTIEQKTHNGTKCLAKYELTKSNVLILRTLCDMYVYFKWIPQYTPIPTLEYLAGMFSGFTGVWLVWKDVRVKLPARLQTTDKITGKHSFRRLQSMSTVLVEGDDGGQGSD